jgi:hypothetical protein
MRFLSPLRGFPILLIVRFLGLTPQAKYMSRLRRSRSPQPPRAGYIPPDFDVLRIVVRASRPHIIRFP